MMKKIILNVLFLFSISILFAQQPIVTYCGKTGGSITYSEATCCGQLTAVFNNDTVPIVQFELTTIKRGMSQTARSNSGFLSSSQRSILKSLSTRERFYFDNIRIKVNNKIMNAPSLEFKVY